MHQSGSLTINKLKTERSEPMVNTRAVWLATAGLLMLCVPDDAGAQSSGGGSSASGGAGPSAPSTGSKSSPTQTPLSVSPSAPKPPSGQPSVGTPAPRPPKAAPLSPPPTTEFPGSSAGAKPAPGGQAGIGGSTSESPSRPGGGGDSVEACMGFWDAGTHMSKQEWRAACRRVENRLQNLSPPPARKSKRDAQSNGAKL